MQFLALANFFSLTLLVAAVTGCSETSDTTTVIPSGPILSATVVDPYIEGARFCIDANFSKTCDAEEVVSTLSSSSGVISFDIDDDLSADTLIIADPTQLGNHNGVSYALEMSAIIGSGTSSFVISPMTTLQGKTADTTGGVLNAALSNANIVTLLQTAGLADITEADITANPMDNISSLSGVVTNVQLARIRAALVVYGFSRVFEVSNTLNSLSPSEIMISGTDTTNSTGVNGVYQILSTMVSAVTNAISPATIASAQVPIDAANTTIASFPGGSSRLLPAATAEVIVKTGVAIINRIAGDAATACNNNNGDYNAGLTTANSFLTNSTLSSTISNLGVMYYGAHNKSSLETLLTYASAASMVSLGAPAELDTGMSCVSGNFTVDGSLNISCVP